jgi:hypothetical protein
LAIIVVVVAAGAYAALVLLNNPNTGGSQTQAPGRPGFGTPAGARGQQAKAPEAPVPVPDAGVKVESRPATIQTQNPAAFVPRSDPFALLPVEIKAMKSLTQHNLLAEIGGFRMYVQPRPHPLPDAVLHPLEPQPYRRLAGIVRGESIAAILEQEGAIPDVQVVKPGDKVGEWTVRSIDSEKAVLYRPGNKRPNVITVRLETKPTLLLSMPGSGGGGGDVGPGGGPPGPVGPGGPSGGGGGRLRGGGGRGGGQ